ncbi:GNAT family N-acetyltransferase [Mesorhizobium xinjiangense]|uniref:GNAT family N-acetyltransferase n=1 Tax=Mesorhizobium xinjiangense TaxID=2678685 RepID=UPI0012EE2561|nr:GNAT family N-acetyltransferase [Mesorhizobium xinjiangense]
MAGARNSTRGTAGKLTAREPGGIRLRPPLPGESAALTALCLRSKAHWGYSETFMRACTNELTLRENDLATETIRVAEADGTPAGMAEISVAGHEACLEKLFVEPGFMGRGVGRLLMAWARDEAMKRGATTMTIDADPDAAGFYRRHGAQDAGRTPSGSIPGRMLPRLVLDLDLRRQ